MSGSVSPSDLLEENVRLCEEIGKLRLEQKLQREALLESAMVAGDEQSKELAAELKRMCCTVSQQEEEIDQLRLANSKLQLEADEAKLRPGISLRVRSPSNASVGSVALQEENDELQQQLEERSHSLVRAAMRSQRTDKDVDAVKQLASELDRVSWTKS